MQQQMSLDDLRSLIDGAAVAIRGTATLEPAGGPGDKVFPPTHSVDKNAKQDGAKYAFERRRIDGREVECVLLDSVQSQANRMEEALEELWKQKQIALPVIKVDLKACAPDVQTVTSLTAPHRVADALLRDSMTEEGTLFRLSELGRSFTDATPKDATSLFRVCPTGLVFGLWDSTGPRGGLGAKFARALVSELVGVGAVKGVKTASRLDPAGIVNRAAEIYVAKDSSERWTVDPELAQTDKDKPVKLGDGRPTEVNHSNIPPDIDSLAGGVTIEYATQTVVVSLAGLRKLGFAEGHSEARTVLAALGLLAILAAQARGHDLRSRCLLVPRPGHALKLEAIHPDGTTHVIQLDLAGAIDLYNAAVEKLPKSLAFAKKPGEPLATLLPSAKLAHLITRSRELAAASVEEVR